MEAAHHRHRFRVRYCGRLGLVHQSGRQRGFPRKDSFRPGALSGRLCDRTHPRGAVPFSTEEMGLLDSMAHGKCIPARDAYLCRSRVYADCLRPLPH